MGEIDELRARVIASMPVSSNSIPNCDDRKVDRDKEEGELSASDDETLIGSQCIAVGTSNVAELHTVGMQIGVGLNCSQGQCLYESKLPIPFGALHTHNSYSKHVEKKQVPSKPSNCLTRSGHTPSKAKAKFLIKFSDETESDSEEDLPSKAGVALETKGQSSEPDEYKKPEKSALPKPNVVPRAGRNHLSMMQMKIPSTHASVSAVSRIKDPSSLTSRAFLPENDLYFQKHASLNTTVAGKKRGYIQVADSTNSEVEHLRQEIAMLENELKHKNVPQIKERGPSSDDDIRPTKFASVNALESTSKKPIKKRQKMVGPSQRKMNINGEWQFLASNEPNRESAMQARDGTEKGEHADALRRLSNVALNVKRGHHSCVAATRREGYNEHVTKSVNLNLVEKTVCADGEIACLANIPSVEQSSAEGQQLCTLLHGTGTSHIFKQQSNSNDSLHRFSKRNLVTSGDRNCQHTACGAFYASEDNRYLLKWKDREHRLGRKLKSLMKEEELLDKELENAQELRRKIELEEISALKAYRKAQRALIDANRRCNHLYHRRDLLSLRLRALQMEESSSSLSSILNKQGQIELGFFMEDSNADADLLPNLGCQLQTDYDECNVLQTDHDPSGTSFVHLTSPQIVGSNPVSEPDASTSELGTRYAGNAVSSPSNHPAASADEDEETSPSSRKKLGPSLARETNADSSKKGVEGMSEKRAVKSAWVNMQDSRLLEASLRSKLFQRLGRRTLGMNSGLHVNEDSKCDRVANRGMQNYKDHMKAGNFSDPSDKGYMEQDQNQMADSKGNEGERISGQGQLDMSCDDYGSRGSIDPEESTSPLKEGYGPKCSTGLKYTSGFSLPSANLKVVFRHMKVVVPDICALFQTRKNDIPCVETMSIQDGSGDVTQMLATEAKIESLVSTAGDTAVNSFWPICMFEFRGICNNEECPWQHARDYYKQNLKQLTVSPLSDSALLHCNAAEIHSIHRQNYLAVPTYWIGAQLIKVNSFSSGFLLARNVWQYHQSGFCTFFGIPFLMQRVLPSDVPCLCPKDGHPGNQKSLKGPSFYHQIQDDLMKQLMQGSGDVEQILELSIDIFNRKAHDLGMKEKVLAILSRCLEAHPNSVVLWVVYLHMYYMKEKGVWRDDMIHLAIQYNGDSYELWLLYIHSRMQLHSRLEAYDSATREFISKACSSSGHKHASSCLVDLLLEMLDFLCMSGNVDKAILRINELIQPAPKNSSNQMAFSDVLDCVTVPEKCTLWVCLVYLAVYKKLPEIVLQRFEFEQELPSGIEWPPIQLTVEEKGLALNLFEKAVHSVVSINGGSSGRDNDTEAAVWAVQLLCVSHVRCVAALEGYDCCSDLLVRYMKLYPTCCELSLMWARKQKDCLEQIPSFEGFEDVLLNWPKEEPGIQCIWNQYAEFALENASVALVKNLMVRWFTTFHAAQNKENVDLMERVEDSDGQSRAPSSVTSNIGFHSIQRDEMFGLLNLSVYHVLHNNITEARVVLNKALELARGVDFVFCIKHHVIFQIFYDVDIIKEFPTFIAGYLTDVRASTNYEPLSRRFLKSIKRSKARALVENFLGPVSLDSSLINSILEILYGPSLLPDKFNKLGSLVDFVEALMLILPANYRLALSVCKFIQSQNLVGAASAPFKFWASSLLVNSIFQAVPVAPEHVWVEAAEVLGRLESENFPDRFHELAVLVYPFSVKLWQSYYKLCMTSEKKGNIIGEARERGIILG